jgi:hypothetical protein
MRRPKDWLIVLLLIAAQQEENLGLKRIASSVGVKTAEKRVLFEHFQENLGG